MAEETSEVYAFCNICKQNVPLDITKEDVEKSTSGLTTVVSIHGTPQHAIMVYLDKQLKVRGVEYPSLFQVKESAAIEPDSSTPTDTTHDLKSIISSFSDKQSTAIKSFAQIVAQIILGNSLYLIHTNQSIAAVVKEQLDELFTDQRTHLFVISYDEMDTVSGMRPTIYDLQYGTFVSKGVAIETSYFEQLIREVINDQNGFSVLQNEYSKLMYSYRRIWELLSSGAKMYTQKRLAYLASIDLSLVPLLLKMAENEGINVASRVR